MKISTIPITHRIKHLQPIFSISKNRTETRPGAALFASGGINGEMKLWDESFTALRTVKKHAGSVTCVKFSHCGRFLASSGDDGKVCVFESRGCGLVKTIKHQADVTHIEWTGEFLISSDLNGEVLIFRISPVDNTNNMNDGRTGYACGNSSSDYSHSFTEFKRLKHHGQAVLGLCVSPDFRWLCSYSQEKIILYEDFNLKAEKNIKKGVILENLNSKISFSPNGKFVSVGLQFNKKKPTVDIMDLELNSVFSLVGHAAPSEITCFCPFSFKKLVSSNIIDEEVDSKRKEDGSRKECNNENDSRIVDSNVEDNKERADNRKEDGIIEEDSKPTDKKNDNKIIATDRSSGHKQSVLKYCVIAVASQDLSLSVWNTLNPKPFVLLKNFTESPILDMFWDGLVLYVSSYDGIVRAVSFQEEEFGEKVENEDEDLEFELPFSERSIEMQRNYEKRIEKLDFNENIEIIRLSPFIFNGEFDKSDFIQKDISNDILDGKESTIRESVTKEPLDNRYHDKKNERLDNKDFKKNNEPTNYSINKDSDKKNDAYGANVEGNNDVLPVDSNANNDKMQYKNEQISLDKSLDIRKEIPVEPGKPKRIVPVMIDKVKTAVPVVNSKNGSAVVLYDVNIPERLKLTKPTAFRAALGDFTVELGETGDVSVLRAGRIYYTLRGPCNKICINEKFVVVYTTHVQIYELSTGCLVLPFIFVKLSYLDLLCSDLLILDVYGDFTVISLENRSSNANFGNKRFRGSNDSDSSSGRDGQYNDRSINEDWNIRGRSDGLYNIRGKNIDEDRNIEDKSINEDYAFHGKTVCGKLARTKDLARIQLSKTHFLVAEYSSGEIVFYDRRMCLWLSVNSSFNSITSTGVDFLNDNDDTMAELELSFVHFSVLGDQKNMVSVIKQFISLVKRVKKLDDFVENKIEKMLSLVENKKTLLLLLEEMNREMFLQRFVFKMSRKLEVK